jgi:tetratricopeptide (TPR) repeat protein
VRATRLRRRAWIASALIPGLLCAPLAALGQSDPGDSQKGQQKHHWSRQAEPSPELEDRPRPSQKVLERHAKALELLYDERPEEAKQELDKLYFKRMNSVGQAMILRDYGFIANAEGNREEARRRFAEAIAVPDGLLPHEATDLRYQIAMLWMQDENWQKAAETLELWFTEEPNPNSTAYYILALNYYQQEQFDKAVVPARKAVEGSDAPKESWLQLLLAIYLLDQKYQESIPILEQLVARFPNKSYFLSLSTVYGALGNFEEAAIPLQLAYEDGYLDEQENLKRLGQMLLFLNVPYRAGEVLAKEIDRKAIQPDSEALAMLANSWIAAREYDDAIEPMQRAASLADDGELYVRLAQVYVQRENWAGATAALDKALAKGDLQDPGSAHLLMGIAFYSQKNASEARRWFESATHYDAAREEAKVWIAHIDEEQAHQEATSASGG